MNTASVAQHYGSAGIAERVLAAFREANGPNAPVTPEALAPFDHFHGRGIIATQELAAQLALQPGERVLDIGSGIGWRARWSRTKLHVQVTAVVLTREVFARAGGLAAGTGGVDRVTSLPG